MMFPKYDFSDPDLDYSDVEQTNKEMFSYLQYKGTCCEGKPIDEVMCQVSGLFEELLADDSDAYKLAVKSIYLLLYPLTN